MQKGNKMSNVHAIYIRMKQEYWGTTGTIVSSNEPDTLRQSITTPMQSTFWFCLQVFHQAGPPQRVDCLASMGLVNSTDRDKLTANKLTAKQRFRCSDFVADFVAVISSLSEGLNKMALGIVKIYLGSPFSAHRRCSRSVGSRSVCRGQLSWTLGNMCKVSFLRTQ